MNRNQKAVPRKQTRHVSGSASDGISAAAVAAIEKPMTQLECVQERLAGTISELHIVLAQLEKRLDDGGVLGDQLKDGGAGEQGASNVGVAPLIGDINIHSDRVDVAIVRVNELLRRLCL